AIGGQQRTYVVFGAPGLGAPGEIDLSALDGTNGFVVIGADDAVSGAGDVNGDGFDDLLLGNSDLQRRTGGAFVVFGGTHVGAGGTVRLSSLDGRNGFAMPGIDRKDYA